jgi:hypothetical protein
MVEYLVDLISELDIDINANFDDIYDKISKKYKLEYFDNEDDYIVPENLKKDISNDIIKINDNKNENQIDIDNIDDSINLIDETIIDENIIDKNFKRMVLLDYNMDINYIIDTINSGRCNIENYVNIIEKYIEIEEYDRGVKPTKSKMTQIILDKLKVEYFIIIISRISKLNLIILEKIITRSDITHLNIDQICKNRSLNFKRDTSSILIYLLYVKDNKYMLDDINKYIIDKNDNLYIKNTKTKIKKNKRNKI